MSGGRADIPQAVKRMAAVTPNLGFRSIGSVVNFWTQHSTFNFNVVHDICKINF